ncbi:uncharacterized protein EHS24_006914 [Apiotrichum porosum]|uniref:Ammonia (Ammonium) transport outward n=1 Tax=Apiotrichum porosum TaxID=105984 RepID=A0A427XWH1_9TREE|nr:uncharacterized protein EHS24_006914 [Apiotrichum porosum]RSH83246.1 hypothetical protein EHS24_006914 [Apiotrichum porosum]
MSAASEDHQTPVYLGAGDLEKGRPAHIERTVTPGGHPVDYSQPAIPAQHRKFGNPLPAGLLSFATGFWVVGLYTLNVRGVVHPHAVFPLLNMFLGITQTLVGWFEMFIGNTFSATIFICYGGFIWSYSMLFLPGFAVTEAYMVDGVLTDEFNQAIGLFMVVWTIVTFFFCLAALRSSVAVLGTLSFTGIAFMCMAIQNLTGSDHARVAAGAFQLIAGSFGYWAALSGYWTPDVTYAFIRAPPIMLSKAE